jgi:hypothetical protein
MTKKVYKTAYGKTVDLGALILQNENVRAVGNMNVNARGDVLDSSDRVIDSKNNQIHRQNERQTRTVTPAREVHTSTREAQQARAKKEPTVLESVLDTAETTTPVAETSEQPSSGLAGAIARSLQSGAN